MHAGGTDGGDLGRGGLTQSATRHVLESHTSAPGNRGRAAGCATESNSNDLWRGGSMRESRAVVARVLLLAVALTLAAGSTTPSRDALADGPPPPRFTQCPPVGQDRGCAILITINPDGSTTIDTDPNQPPFDGSDDVLVGVLNSGPTTVPRVPLTSSG